MQGLDVLKKQCEECTNCPLHKSRKNIVFSGGRPNNDIMLIGEAPGANEDDQGQPFVGRSGRLLDALLAEVNIYREKNLYICNTIKCRPPQNRNPNKEELKACRQYLDAQINILKPRVILLCGKVAVESILATKEPISKIRGQWFDGPHGASLMPLFHPAYLLRSPSEEEGKPKWLMRQDLLAVAKKITSS